MGENKIQTTLFLSPIPFPSSKYNKASSLAS